MGERRSRPELAAVRRQSRSATAAGGSVRTDDAPGVGVDETRSRRGLHDGEHEAGSRAPRERASGAGNEETIARAVAGDDADAGAVDVRDPRVGLGPGPARGADARPGERPAHVAVRLERGELVLARRDDEAAERRPARLAVRRRAGASSRPRCTTQTPASEATSSRPGAGSEKSAGCARSTPTPRGSRRARRGRAGSATRRDEPPTATATSEREAQPARTRARPARARRTRRETTFHARSRGLVLAGDLDPLELAPHSSLPERVEAAAQARVDGAARKVERSAISPGVNSSR